MASDDYDWVPVFDLQYFGVHEAVQQKGYGSIVYRHLLRLVDECAFATRFLYLECWESNPALAIYQHWGWRCVSRDAECAAHGRREYLSKLFLDRFTPPEPA